jgi:RNA polymerase sigma-70 factor (ECF subfamily)
MTVAVIVNSETVSASVCNPLGVACHVTQTLLQRVAAGEMAAMQECIDEYGGLVWSLARRFCPSPAEAEDAVQEVFIAVWENAGRYDEEKGAEVTFVAMIARRRLIDRGRKYERREKLVTHLKSEQEGRPPGRTDDTTTGDEAERALEAMEQLSPDQQRVLRLAIHHGCTHEQIAGITELPLGTVKTHARRGLMRVRDLLAESTSDQSVGQESP